MPDTDTLTKPETDQASTEDEKDTSQELSDSGADGADTERQPQEAGAEAENTTENQLADLPEGWADHKEVKSLLAKHGMDTLAKLQSEKDKQIREIRADHVRALNDTAQQAIAGNAVQEVSKAVGMVATKLEEGLTPEEADAVLKPILDQYENFAAIYNGATLKAATTQGGELGFQRAQNFITEGLSKEGVTVMEAEIKDVETALTLKELPSREAGFVRLLAKRDEQVRIEATAKVESERKDRETAEDRATTREKNGKAPDTQGRGSAGGRSYTLKQLKGMSRDEIMAIPKEERDSAIESAQ